MIGKYGLYDSHFASTSNTGWYEAIKSGKNWRILECYTDGSCDYRTLELCKQDAIKALDKLNKNSSLPFYIDHSIKVIHKVI